MEYIKLKQKVARTLRQYALRFSCKCKKCDRQVVKSTVKGFEYLCPHCKELLFASEVTIDKQPVQLQAREILIKDLMEYFN